MATRTDEILQAVDQLLAVHDAWEADETAPVQPTEAFENAIIAAIETGDNGDIPAQCREVCQALARLRVEWDAYATGLARTADLRPVGRFWGAFRNLINCRAGATPHVPKQPEPVYLLLEQRVSDYQIAFHIWGHGGKGPFVTPSGQPDTQKIREEAKEPGKYTANWVHPEELRRAQHQQGELKRRLSAVSTREEVPQTIEKASVEEMLREGQYPDVIAKVKNVSLEDVLSAARRAGITPSERPNLASMRAPQEPGSSPQAERAASPDDATIDDDEDELDDDEPSQSVEEVILELNDGTRGNAEIKAALAERGFDVTVQKISAVIREAKKAVPAST